MSRFPLFLGDAFLLNVAARLLALAERTWIFID